MPPPAGRARRQTRVRGLIPTRSPSQVLQQAKQCRPPDVVLLSAAAAPDLAAAARRPLGDEPGAPGCAEFAVRLERSAMFRQDRCAQVLAALRVRGGGGGGGGGGAADGAAALGTRVDLSRPQLVCALGALLSVLQAEGLLREDDDGDDGGGEGGGGEEGEAPRLGAPRLSVGSLGELNLEGCAPPPRLPATHPNRRHHP